MHSSDFSLVLQSISANVLKTSIFVITAASLFLTKSIWYLWCVARLVPFVQFKKREKHPWWNTPPLVFFTVFKLYKWYRIAQGTSLKINKVLLSFVYFQRNGITQGLLNIFFLKCLVISTYLCCCSREQCVHLHLNMEIQTIYQTMLVPSVSAVCSAHLLLRAVQVYTSPQR